MFITFDEKDKPVKLPADLIGKPRGLPWLNYCKALRHALQEYNGRGDICLTIHTSRSEYATVAQELASLAAYQNHNYQQGNAVLNGTIIKHDIPDYL